uniref:BTB domain-containing protein n=1 Tax=Panagrolaimus davidi TaxID=227884 RepID=A0A914PM84_9BILA
MLLTTTLRKVIKLSFTSETKIVFNETTELSVDVSTEDSFNYALHVEEIKGDISNLKITPLNGSQNLPCDIVNGTYKTNAEQLQHPFQFLIKCEVEYKAITPSTWSTGFWTCSNFLKFLNLFECLEGKIPFANYEFYKLHWFIKKVESNIVEFTIQNPQQIQINGQKDDLNLIANVHQDLQLELFFVYDPKVIEEHNINLENTKKAEISTISLSSPTISTTDSVLKENPILVETPIQEPIVKDTGTSEDEQCHANQKATIIDSVLDKSVSDDGHVPIITSPEMQLNEISSEDEKPEAASKPPTKSQNMAEATFFKTGDYVILISSDGKRIFSSASLLTRNSYIFATILKNIKKSPVKINVEEFNSDVIYSALDFLNGKNDAINGKEIELYHFSDKYSFRDLKKVCCSKFDKLLSLKNVCEIIQIAYANYFEELKLKCIEMIRLNTEKIVESELKALPTEIYAEIFI